MAKKFRLIGMPISVLDEVLSKKEKREMIARPARLIPANPRLSELSLASVFLSSLTFVKEFRELFLKDIKMSRSGSLRVFTEVSFPHIGITDQERGKKSSLRVDGLILQVIGKEIRDAALLEFKMGNQDLHEPQVSAYMNLAKELKIPRLITISNQFVPHITNTPVQGLQKVNGVNLYHFSWKHLIAMGSVLLTDNDTNIENPVEHEIMNEVMSFFRNENAQTRTFDAMSKEWAEVVEAIRVNKPLTKNDPRVATVAHDWVQEEQDLNLKLSDELGLMVDSRKRAAKDFNDRIEIEKKAIVENGILESQFKISGIVSPLKVQAHVLARKVVCTVEVKAPLSRSTSTGRLNWLKAQLERSRKNNQKVFEEVLPNVWIEPMTKGRGHNPKQPYKDFDTLVDESKDTDIRVFRVSFEKDLAADFTRTKKFIEKYEEMVLCFYRAIVQNLKNWEEPPPKMSHSVEDPDEKISEEE